MPKDMNYATRRATDPEKNRSLREFRGIDGEGGNVPEPGTLFGTRHQYLSLRAGEHLLELGRPLTYEDCFTFLTMLPKWHENVAYFFDYDVTMMIRTMPEERADRLLHRERRTNQYGGVLPLDFDGWQLEYLPHKEFRVRDVREGGNRAKWVSISDTGQFFQGSFLNTLKKWNVGTEDEQEMIRKGKLMRADFAEFTDETRAYNALECYLLEQLMTDFRQVCEDTGYVPKKWQGPGYLASAMLDAHNVPRRDDIPILANDIFKARAQAAYYGGRFEITATGPIPGPVYQYDINGAYVSLLRQLPCLIHGEWRETRDRPRGGTWFGEVRFNHEGGHYLYHLPVRRPDGTIFYPKQANGTYWGCEVEAAEAAGTRIEFISGWYYVPHCSCRWFDFVDDYYAERLRLGKSAKGYVLKLAGNSIYGKLAQSIGYAPYANPVWAGLITAGCRAMLVNAYREQPAHCVMLATDGLFMTRPLSVPVSRELGEWEFTEHPNGIFIIQPGLYFLDEEAKSRGVERGKISNLRPEFEEKFNSFISSGGVDHTVSVPVENFVTAKQAIMRRRWDLAGTWVKDTRSISFYWGIKRIPGIAFDREGMCRTVPWKGGDELESVPYDRMIGGGLRIPIEDRYMDAGLQEADRMDEQPDWVEPLFDRD